MPDYLTAFQAELYSVIATALPEIVVPDGGGTVRPTLFTTVQALELSIVEFTNDATAGKPGRPVPPYLFVDIGQANPWADATCNQDVKVCPISFYYLDCDHGAHKATQNYVSGRLWALKLAVEGDHSTWQSIEFSEPDTSPSNPLTMKLAGNSKSRIKGGMLVYRPGWQVIGG